MDPISEARKNYDAVAHRYDDHYRGPFWELWEHLTLAHVEPFLSPGARILDAGAGTGRFSTKFLERGHAVTLLDPSEAMLRVARRKIEGTPWASRAEFAVGSIERMDFPDGRFDLVFCEGDPLSYCLASFPQAARELVRVVKPGGGLYVSCKSRWFDALAMLTAGEVDRGLTCMERGDATDAYGAPVRAFYPEELRRVFEEAGASDVRVAGKVVLAHVLGRATFEKLVKDDAHRRRWLAVEEELGRDPAFAGAAGRLYVVGRKR